MISNLPSITGIGSVSPYGALAGVIVPRPIEPGAVPGVPRAYSVDPFRPTDVVPGLKTRRLDRLSVWSLAAASLAIKDSGLDLDQVDRSRFAVVFATGLGCIELTESFFQSAATHGWSGTDPIVFPETLGNAPASHVARHFDLRGPNITVSSKGLAGECAFLQAISLLRNGQADLALVLAGDTLTRTSYEWYEAAGMLSRGFVPSEGVTAMLLKAAPRSYAKFRAGHFATGTDPAAVVRKVLCGCSPDQRITCAGATAPIQEVLGDRATILPPDPIATGLGDSGTLLQLSVALHEAPRGTPLLLLGASSNAGFAALLLELP